MSRSNPGASNPHPCTRWHDWAGGDNGGVIKYYDKQQQTNITVTLPFTFILLDETATIKGWHDASDSGIYSNELRDTRQDVFVVKAFKGGELASGNYAAIRDRVGAFGGHFVANLYVAYRNGATLALGSLQFKGSALKHWMEFRKSNRKDLYSKAITITGFEEGKKGKVVYRTPTFALSPISDASNAAAVELDKELQAYLSAYMSRTKDHATQISAEELKKADAAIAGASTDAEDQFADAEGARQADKKAAAGADFDDDIPF